MNTEIIVYDIETFAYDFIFCGIDHTTKEVYAFVNDGVGVRNFIEDNHAKIFCGFNNKGYDKYVASAIVNTDDCTIIKDVNDWIIAGNQGWEYPERSVINYKFPQFDLMDDMQDGHSLKFIEGHLGMNIRECDVPFDIDRPLTKDELKEAVDYCIADIKAEDEILSLRIPYLETKISIGNMVGLSEKVSMSLTNAQLTAKFLGAEKVPRSDEREYQYPDNLDMKYIPSEMISFFDRMHDYSIPDEVLFTTKLNIDIGNCPTTIGFGGCHASIDKYREKAEGNRVIRNVDVASYYPHLMTLDGYTSRNMQNPKAYQDVLDTRMEAKKAGDKRKANDLKLIVNTTYGATLAKFNDLYDPLMARSVCITGQLRLVELANHLYQECSSLKIIQINTDGIMVSLDLDDEARYKAICKEWEDRTGFELEEDDIQEIIQKDVNNYIEVATDGSLKIKGSTLVRGLGQAGAFKINNNATIIPEAVIKNLTEGISPEETIMHCNDLSKFMLIGKAGSKYSKVYQIVGDKKVSAQRCNRVYAALDKNLGCLYKVKKSNGAVAKLESLPPHCLIDNSNEATIDQIDKKYYIRIAKRYINDFEGISNKTSKRKVKSLAKEALAILE